MLHCPHCGHTRTWTVLETVCQRSTLHIASPTTYTVVATHRLVVDTWEWVECGGCQTRMLPEDARQMPVRAQPWIPPPGTDAAG